MTGQSWNPETYARNARFVSDLGAPLLELLAPRPGERVLDLGCGDGALTEQLATSGCRVVAVDASAEQVAATRARGIDARVHRAEALPFLEEFDAVLSNAVLHWVKDQAAALAAIHRALKPGGRVVAELGGAGCVAKIRGALHGALRRRGVDPSLHDPWFFPGVDEYRTLLEQAGFAVESLVLFDRPTPLPGAMRAWLETFAQPFLGALPGGEWSGFLDEVEHALRPALYDEGRGWTADYVRLRYRAVRAADGRARPG